MNETKLTPRQSLIVRFIDQSDGISRATIEAALVQSYPSSKATIARDLVTLINKKIILVVGKGKNTRYLSTISNPLLRYTDLNHYFLLEPDQRLRTNTSFTFSVIEHCHDLISDEEKTRIAQENKTFTIETEKLPGDIYRRELERFIIELSWKSSAIEGNTYSLLDTETLIKQRIEAKGHPKEEATMILNHKEAFETILARRKDFATISSTQIMQLHNILVKDLHISAGVRTEPVGITGTTYRPLDNQWQIKEALEKTITAINASSYPIEKALIASALLSYIQPFADGNKRTGRMLANALLLAFDFYPLSYRSVDDTTYKKALVLFYEQHSIYHLKKILLDQYHFALRTYFR